MAGRSIAVERVALRQAQCLIGRAEVERARSALEEVARAELLRLLDALAERGLLRNYEETLRRKDGSLLHTLQNITAVRDAQGRIMQIRGLMLDVTEQKTFQSQLQRERDFNQKILNTTQSMILVLDTAGLISYANRRCYEAGYQESELIGHRLLDWIEPSHQEDLEAALETTAFPAPTVERALSAFWMFVCSVVVAALLYRTEEPLGAGLNDGRISRYAWGRDYHDVIRRKLNAAVERLQSDFPDDRFRAVVDSAPIMERDYARLAGLGWFGKNTLLLNRRLGSYFFLGEIITTLPLAASHPADPDPCSTCTRCIDACPTAASWRTSWYPSA